MIVHTTMPHLTDPLTPSSLLKHFLDIYLVKNHALNPLGCDFASHPQRDISCEFTPPPHTRDGPRQPMEPLIIHKTFSKYIFAKNDALNPLDRVFAKPTLGDMKCKFTPLCNFYLYYSILLSTTLLLALWHT